MARRSKWLTVVEVSEALGLSVRAVYELIERDALPAARHGRATLVAEPELRRFRRIATAD